MFYSIDPKFFACVSPLRSFASASSCCAVLRDAHGCDHSDLRAPGSRGATQPARAQLGDLRVTSSRGATVEFRPKWHTPQVGQCAPATQAGRLK